MSIISRLFSSNPLDSMKLGDLRKAEAQVTYQIQTLQNEQSALKQQIITLFSEAQTIRSDTETSLCAMQIKTISESWQLKAQTCLHLEQDLQLLSNVIGIKEQEKTFRRSGIWKNLQSIDPDTLERGLAKSSINTRDQRALMDELSEITSEHISQSQTSSADESYILSLIAEMRMGNLSSDSAGTKLFSSLSLKQPDGMNHCGRK